MATLQGSYQGTNIYVDKTLSHEQQVAQAAAQMNTTTAPAPTPTATTAPTSNKLAPDTTESDAAKKKLDAAEAQAAQDRSAIQNFLMSQQDTAEIRADAWGDLGVSPEKYFAERKAALAEIGSLTETYNNIVAAKDQQIAQSYDKLASMNFINNQIGQINRNAAPELNRISAQINAKSAVMALMNEDFQLASQLVGQAVEDSLADRRFKMEGMMMLYDMNQDVINRLDSRYQNALNRSIEMAQFEFEQAKEEKNVLRELFLKYPTAGIDIYNDSVEEALVKAQGPAGVAYNMALYGGGGTGTGFVDGAGQPLKLTAGQTDAIAGLNTTIGAANAALQLLASGVSTGPIAGRTLGIKKLFGVSDASQMQLEQLLGKLKADFFKAISGAAVSEAEVQRLSAFLPSITDQESVIKSKLNTLIQETNRTKATLLQTIGGTETGGTSGTSGTTSSGLNYTITY